MGLKVYLHIFADLSSSSFAISNEDVSLPQSQWKVYTSTSTIPSSFSPRSFRAMVYIGKPAGNSAIHYRPSPLRAGPEDCSGAPVGRRGPGGLRKMKRPRSDAFIRPSKALESSRRKMRY